MFFLCSFFVVFNFFYCDKKKHLTPLLITKGEKYILRLLNEWYHSINVIWCDAWIFFFRTRRIFRVKLWQIVNYFLKKNLFLFIYSFFFTPSKEYKRKNIRQKEQKIVSPFHLHSMFYLNCYLEERNEKTNFMLRVKSRHFCVFGWFGQMVLTCDKILKV